MEGNTKHALSANVEPGATGIHYFAKDSLMEITTADKTLMTKIRKLSRKCPDVVIDCEPKIENGNFMIALVPVKCLKLSVPRICNFTVEQRAAIAQRLRKNKN